MIDLQQPLGIRLTSLGGEIEAIHCITPISRKSDALTGFSGGTARLGELTCHPPDLHDRHLCGVGQYHCHGQQGPKLALNVGCRNIGKGLGTVATLQHEGLAAGHAGHLGAKLVALGSEDQRWQFAKLVDHLSNFVG